MDPSRLRKRQIAERLGLSERVLDQYLELKRAEVLAADQEHGTAGPGHPATPFAVEPHPAPVAASRAASRWSRRLQPVSAGRGRE